MLQPFSKHLLDGKRNRNSGMLLDTCIAEWLEEQRCEKTSEIRNRLKYRFNNSQRPLVEAQVQQRSVSKLSLILLDQNLIQRVQVRSQWNCSCRSSSKAAVVNVSYGETKLQTYSMNLMRKLKVVLKCLPVLKRSCKITSWEMIRPWPGLWPLGVPLAQRKPTAVSHY